ncbi:MAG: methyltransferase domain-containing protein [Campylobacterota bacterium]|nr:methyltransferase domain-containing protein [Campylobacterota bacterium]
MKVNTEFSKNAQSYGNYNQVQIDVAKHLLGLIENKPKKIIDIGCGSGAVTSLINYEYEKIYGVDFSKEMLYLHPKSEKIELIHENFDDISLFNRLNSIDAEMIISSSAMQWSKDLHVLFNNIKKLNRLFYGSIFTANTFKTLHQYANVESILLSSKDIKKIAEDVFENCTITTKNYKLYFDTTEDMLRYIKRSGVNGSKKMLSLAQTRELIKTYPLNYLEFEVLFIKV